jgi:hypothetical protein
MFPLLAAAINNRSLQSGFQQFGYELGDSGLLGEQIRSSLGARQADVEQTSFLGILEIFRYG